MENSIIKWILGPFFSCCGSSDPYRALFVIFFKIELANMFGKGRVQKKKRESMVLNIASSSHDLWRNGRLGLFT